VRAWPTILAFALTAAHAGAQALLESTWTLGKKPDAVTIDFTVAAAGN